MPLNQQLAQKIDQAKMVIEDALLDYTPEKCLIAWSAGKDSTLLLKLIIEVCAQRKLPLPRALDIDQQDQFDDLITFRDRIVQQWNIDLVVVRNNNFLDNVQVFGDSIAVDSLNKTNQQALSDIGYQDNEIIWQPESAVCNHLLKTVPINQAIENLDIQAMFTGIRWDEHGARANETYFSHREHPEHMRIHPLLHLTERDIWNIHFALEIPFNDLYQQGYRSLGTKSGTKKNSDLPAWKQNLEQTSERGQRSAEKEKVMEQLRKWGYM